MTTIPNETTLSNWRQMLADGDEFAVLEELAKYDYRGYDIWLDVAKAHFDIAFFGRGDGCGDAKRVAKWCLRVVLGQKTPAEVLAFATKLNEQWV